ncbi:MAG: hypothetical protein HC857_00315 [Synechococcales cyanobacterium RU_4_20]|nr:hypothetical protein [Synechococcales cyanobacterium RU_4_20]
MATICVAFGWSTVVSAPTYAYEIKFGAPPNSAEYPPGNENFVTPEVLTDNATGTATTGVKLRST